MDFVELNFISRHMKAGRSLKNIASPNRQGCKSLLSIGGGIICHFTPILPYFQHWGDEPQPQFFFQGSKLSEEQKEKVFTKTGTLFSPKSSGDLRSDAHHSQILEGMQMKTVLKLLVGIQSNYWGRYIPPSPLGFGTSVNRTKLL